MCLYIGNNQHFLKTGLEVYIVYTHTFQSSDKVFLTLQSVKDKNFICTIEKSDTFRFVDYTPCVCDCIEIYQESSKGEKYLIDKYFIQNLDKYLSELIEYYTERYSKVKYNIIKYVQTNTIEASVNYPWMLEDYETNI